MLTKNSLSPYQEHDPELAYRWSKEKAAAWFESARKAQDQLISRYSEEELEIITDVFEQFTKLWDQEREKLRRGQ